jgi:hypothetical protein
MAGEIGLVVIITLARHPLNGPGSYGLVTTIVFVTELGVAAPLSRESGQEKEARWQTITD